MLLRSRFLAVLAVLALLAVACTSDDDAAEDATPADAAADAPVDAGGDDAGVEAGSSDLRILELGAPDVEGFVEVVVGADDLSLLFVAQGTSLEDDVEIIEIERPDGSIVDGADLLSPSQYAENSVLLPLEADGVLQAGSYRFLVDSVEGVSRTVAVLKAGPVAPVQRIDVVFALVSEVALEAEPSQLDVLADTYEDAGNEIFAPHGLTVGELRFDERTDLVDDFAELPLPTSGTDVSHRELCARLSSGSMERQLTIAVVDRIVDPEDDEGETEGNSAGLPGATVVPGTSTNCVIMQADGTRPVTELAATVWHEAGHAMGLAHTSESTGDTFDLVDDTPECDVDTYDDNGDDFVEQFECPDGDNLMFHDSDALAITDDQAFVLRMHPLFQPA